MLDGLGVEGLIEEAILGTNGELEITELLRAAVETIGDEIKDGLKILVLLEEGSLEAGILNDGDGENGKLVRIELGVLLESAGGLYKLVLGGITLLDEVIMNLFGV